MPDIYDEVLADKKKLLEVAEENAKNKIVSAITPRIKALVERAMLGELDGDMPGDDEDIIGDLAGDVVGDPMGSMPNAPEAIPGMPAVSINIPPANMSAVGGVASGDPAGVSLPGPDGKMVLDVDSLVAVPQTQSSIDSAFELTPESLQVLNTLIGVKQPVDIENVEARTAKMESVAKKINSVKNPTIKDRESARQVKSECLKIFADVQRTRDFLDENWVSNVENKLENVFRGVMEHYSAAGHLMAIVKEMVAINKKAGNFSTLVESRNLTPNDFKKCVKMLKETKSLHDSVRNLHESLGADDDSVDAATVRQVGANLATLYVEIRKMVTKKGKRINEADELDVGGEEMDAGMDASEDAMDVGAEKMLVQLELPASLSDIAAGDQVNVVDVSPAGDGADEMEGMDDMDLDMGDEDVEGADEVDDLGDMDLDAEEDVAADADDELEEGVSESMYEARLNDDDIIEIDEAALVAEMRNMKKLREKKYAIRHGGHGPGDLSDFGGGKGEGEKFVDGQELNQSDDVGSEGFLEEGEEDDLVESDEDLDESELEESDEDLEESFKSNLRAGSTRQKNAVNNKHSKDKQLAEAFEKTRAELAEQKLFNTKLVALNRVLQIPGLKKGQKEKVVETLDKGRTVVEVQQLYSRIVEALKKSNGAVNESVDASSMKGSSSKTTTSASSNDKNDGHPLLEKWNKIAFGSDGNGVIKG